MIGDDIAEALPELRAQALSLMTSTATITRESGEPTWDPETEQMAVGTVTVWTGPARLIRAAGTPRAVDAAGEGVASTSYTVAVPWDIEGTPEDGDRVEIDGVTLWVKAALVGSHRVEVRLACSEHR